MEILVTRAPSSDRATLGTLFVDGKQECVTLEDVVRVDDPATPQNEGAKVWGATAIPAGRYRVIINMSPRLKKPMMRLLNVPNFTGILIHSGNTDINTLGCILVGQQIVGRDYIRGGTHALPALQAKVQAALDRGEEVWITLKDSERQA